MRKACKGNLPALLFLFALLMLWQLGAMKISSVLVEGGGSVNFSLLQAGLVDRGYAFIAPKLVGGRDALTPVEGEGFQELDRAVELENIQLRQLGSDVLLTGIVKRNTEK